MKGKLIMTVEQAADRVAWERVRNSGIGGSDVACIMGLNPWKSAYALYAENMVTLSQRTFPIMNSFIGVRCLNRL